MTDRRYRPNMHVIEAWTFGQSEAPSWQIPAGSNREHLIASAMQHVQAKLIKDAILSRYKSLKSFHRERGFGDFSYDLLVGVINGTDILRPDHLATFVSALGGGIIPHSDTIAGFVQQALKTVEQPRERIMPVQFRSAFAPEESHIAAAMKAPIADDILSAPTGRALTNSVMGLAVSAGAAEGWSATPDIRITVEPPVTSDLEGFVIGWTHDTGARLLAFRTEPPLHGDPIMIDDRAITTVLNRDGDGRATRVLALTLLPAHAGDNNGEFEYAALPATVERDGERARLVWEIIGTDEQVAAWHEATGRKRDANG